jgi:DNA-binding MarR family transcriptional regulator
MHTAVDLERELIRLARAARRAARRVTDTTPGLDHSGYVLLAATDRLGAAHAGEIADVLGLDKSTVSRQLSLLADRGLVERTADPADRRAQVVSLSGHGRERLETARAAHRADLETVLVGWTPQELEGAVAVLSRLSDGLGAICQLPSPAHLGSHARSQAHSHDHSHDPSHDQMQETRTA